jgi:hypothetical protein
MTKTTEAILKKLKELSYNDPLNVIGKVKAVDEGKLTCTVTIDKLDYPDIRLTSIVDSSDVYSYVVPKSNSWVIVSFLEGSETDAFINVVCEIDKIIIRATSIIFNNGENKGLAKVDGLKSKLNAIESSINSLKNALSGWTPVPNDGGAALKSAVTSWAASQLQQTQLSDIENDKIKH